MKAKIRLDGSLLEQIDVQNGLRQSCCMAPVLFNLFTCLVERWQARVEGADGAGIELNYKYNQKLFRRYIRNADMRMLTECPAGIYKIRHREGYEGVPKNMLKFRLDYQQLEDQAHGDWKAGGRW